MAANWLSAYSQTIQAGVAIFGCVFCGYLIDEQKVFKIYDFGILVT